jgi:hypothetical protein
VAFRTVARREAQQCNSGYEVHANLLLNHDNPSVDSISFGSRYQDDRASTGIISSRYREFGRRNDHAAENAPQLVGEGSGDRRSKGRRPPGAMILTRPAPGSRGKNGSYSTSNHRSTPNYQLAPDQIDSVVEFILSLKAK